MSRIPRDLVDAVRDRTDIVEVVSRHVKLERRGASWIGLCPFHQEKTPSFNVIPNKAMYYCFGCQAGGDVFRFVQLVENQSFYEAVHQLAGPAGVTIETRELSEDERRRYRARATLYEVMEEAAAWFESQLWTSFEGAVAREYLERRGMGDEISRRARLGWAPPGWSNLSDHLVRKGFAPALLLAGGLSRRRESGDGGYDTFRERLMVPIRDERGRVIAFGGRLLQGDGPKYINSPETELYEKGRVLYALDMAATAIRQKRRIILVEGYFDVLSMHNAGFRETIATCGTALTRDHVQRILKLDVRDVIFLSDSDAAGELAAEKTADEQLKVFEHDVESRRVLTWRLDIPDFKDPDELIRARGAAAMEAAVEARTPLVVWLIRRKLKRYGHTASGKEKVLDELLDLLQEVSQVQLAEIARYLGVPEPMVYQRVQVRRRSANAPPPPTGGWRPSRETTHVLWLLVHHYPVVADLVQRVDPGLLDPVVVPVVARLLQGEAPVRILDDLADPGVQRTLTAVVARERLYTREEAAMAICDVFVRLARPVWDARAAELHEVILRATREGRPEVARRALEVRQHGQLAWRGAEEALRGADVDSCVAALNALRAASARVDAPSV